MNLLVTTEQFWRTRLWEVAAYGYELHQIIYRTDIANWNRIQTSTAKVLRNILPAQCKLLDAGCGYGALYDVLHSAPHFAGVEYTGVDMSLDLINIGKLRHPDLNLLHCSLEDTNFSNDYFDFTVLRSVTGMMHDNNYSDVWRVIFSKLKMISKNIIIMEYGAIDTPTVMRKDIDYGD
jgi:SAM-dependent methyltransferase